LFSTKEKALSEENAFSKVSKKYVLTSCHDHDHDLLVQVLPSQEGQ